MNRRAVMAWCLRCGHSQDREKLDRCEDCGYMPHTDIRAFAAESVGHWINVLKNRAICLKPTWDNMVPVLHVGFNKDGELMPFREDPFQEILRKAEWIGGNCPWQ